MNIEDIKQKIHDKAASEINKRADIIRKQVEYELHVLVTEVSLGDSDLFNVTDATPSEKAFLENGGAEVRITDTQEEGNIIRKQLSIGFPDGASTNLRRAVNLAIDNAKRMLSQGGGDNALGMGD